MTASINLGWRTTNWKALENRKRAEAEVEAIVIRAWAEIEEEARVKAVEEKVRQLQAAWPRAGK